MSEAANECWFCGTSLADIESEKVVITHSIHKTDLVVVICERCYAEIFANDEEER